MLKLDLNFKIVDIKKIKNHQNQSHLTSCHKIKPGEPSGRS